MERNTENNTSNKVKKTPTGGGIKPSLHGYAYQIKLLMLFLYRARKHGYNFSLSTEMDEAESFDDLVFSYIKENEQVYRFLQAKHKLNKTVTAEDLLKEQDDDYAVLKYFVSYRKIIRNAKFSGDFKDFIICSNAVLEDNVVNSLEEINYKTDDFFHQKLCPSAKCYKLKKEGKFYEDLYIRLKNPDVLKLAEKMAEIAKGKDKNLPSHPLLKRYRGWLLNNVFDKEKTQNGWHVNFKEDLIKQQDSDDEMMVKFKTIFQLRIEGQIHEVLKKRFKVLESLISTDNLPASSLSFEMTASDEEINNFLDKFILAVNQPNEIELGAIIKEEMEADISNGALVAGVFLEYVVDWVKEIHVSNLTFEDIDNFFRSLDQKLAGVRLVGVTLAFKSHINTNYTFKSDLQVAKIINDFLGDSEKQLLVLHYKSQLLTKIKLLQALSLIRKGEDIWLDFKLLQKLYHTDACPVKAFSSNAFKLLVIEIDVKTPLNESENILKKLFSILETNLNEESLRKRIIMLISTEQKQNAKKFFFDLIDLRQVETAVDDCNNFTNLETQSRHRLLFEREILLQNKVVKLSSILNDKSQLLAGDVLSQIICDKTIEVGTSLSDDNYDKVRNYYVERSIQRLLKIKFNELENDTSFRITNNIQPIENLTLDQDIVLVSEKEEHFMTLCLLYRYNIVHWIKNIDSYVCKSYLDSNINSEKTSYSPVIIIPNNQVTQSELLSSDVIILVSDHRKDYDKLTEKYFVTPIHWVKKVYDEYFWQESQGIPREWCQEITNKMDELFNTTNVVVALPNSLLAEEDIRKSKIIIIFSSEEDDFTYVYEHYADKTIYEVKCNTEHFFQQSSKINTTLRAFVDYSFEINNDYCFESRPIWMAMDRSVAIEAEPGMGKSTTLTHTALKLQEESPDTLWIVKINLVNLLKTFSHLTTINEIEAIKFLYSAEKFYGFRKNKREVSLNNYIVIQNNGDVILKLDSDINIEEKNILPINLFNEFYNRGKVVVLLDGFDEISPKFKELVLQLVKVLQCLKIYKLFVTTRPYNIQYDLERALNTFAYTLHPLNSIQQFSLFLKFWEHSLKVKLDETKTRSFVDSVMEIWSKHIDKDIPMQMSKFIQTPLHIEMIAIVFEEEFKEYISSGSTSSYNDELRQKFQEHFTLYGLYEQFLKIKLRLIYHDSDEEDLTRFYAMEEHKEKTLENHKLAAFLEIFTPDEIKQLFTEKKLRGVRGFIKLLKEGKDKTGIIDRVVDDKPHFIHRTYAEFFAADLMYDLLNIDNETDKESITNFLYYNFVNNYTQVWVIFKFLNYKLVTDSEYKDILTAILNGDFLAREQVGIKKIRDRYGRTPLHLTCCTNNFNRSQFTTILEKDRRAQLVQDKLFKWTPLHYAIITHKCGDFGNEESNYNLQKFAWLNAPHSINTKDYKGKTPLMLAIQRNCQKSCIMQMICKLKPKMNIQDEQGKTALHYLIENNKCDQSLVPIFIEFGANPEINESSGVSGISDNVT